MSNKLQLRVFICALLFFAASMSAMLVYAQNKAVVIDEVQGQPGMEEVAVSEKVIIKNLHIKKENDSGSFSIPLPQGVTAEQVSIENKYILQELWVSIEGCDGAFFDQQWISGDTSSILSGTYESREDRVVLKLLLGNIYECKNLLEHGRLLVEPVNPHSVYDKIVVIDPLDGSQIWGAGKGSISENQVALEVARQLQSKVQESDMKFYFTRLENVERSLQLRQYFVETLKPDLVIEIGTSQDAEAFGGQYGVQAWYNTYFTPEISSVKLADELVKNVVIKTVGKGNGVWDGQDESRLYFEAKAPAVLLQVGYLSNEKERELLAMDEYCAKIAEGIYTAILNMYEGEETGE
ncbi:MAG: N-acetylmuramoyl-L-alanine amidase [Lachnospiraceae bacterium]|nr:N-acetylmuramoyl-L-alanine amidase [Lachnospiraceae bacterium]